MKEFYKLRVNKNYSNLLFDEHDGKNLGSSIKQIEIESNDPRISKIRELDEEIYSQRGDKFYYGWEIIRKYKKSEIAQAKLFHIKINKTFESAGEECGTIYDETTACKFCGVGRAQKSFLNLKKGSIPKLDISRTIAGEIIVSDNFVEIIEKYQLPNINFKEVLISNKVSNYYQIISSELLEISNNTVVGLNPFDLSTSSMGEIYKCPLGHTLGLNLISEPYVTLNDSQYESDFLSSSQSIGVKRGLLRPNPLYFGSQKFKKLIEQNKIKGLSFEIAHII